jgi:muramidase (phage lysozyme)
VLLGTGDISMAIEFNPDTNPNLIDVYLLALKEKESSNRYNLLHKPGVIPDLETGKPIKVQALGAYGILDINWNVWSKQAGLEGADWRDPKAQDTVAKFKVQEYFNKYGSWDLVSIAWFAGPGTANTVSKGFKQGMDKKDNMGTSVKDYVAGMNNLITEKMMEIKIEPEVFDMAYRGEPKGPMEKLPQVGPADRTMQPMSGNRYAAQLFDAMNRANNPSGKRPDLFSSEFNSQVPQAAGGFEAAQIKTGIRREEAK